MTKKNGKNDGITCVFFISKCGKLEGMKNKIKNMEKK